MKKTTVLNVIFQILASSQETKKYTCKIDLCIIQYYILVSSQEIKNRSLYHTKIYFTGIFLSNPPLCYNMLKYEKMRGLSPVFHQFLNYEVLRYCF